MQIAPRASRLKRHLPRHAKTAETIGRQIMGGDLKPGSILPNAALLAQEHKLSRPAMREAIKILAAKGLLSAAPRRGTVVRPRADWNRLDDDVLSWEADVAPSARFIRDLFELRRMVEPEAAALAAERATDVGLSELAAALEGMTRSGVRSAQSIAADMAFHRAILTHSGNDFLATFAPAISASLQITFETQRSIEPPRDHFMPQHQAVYDAIAAHDAVVARNCSLILLRHAEQDALLALAKKEKAGLEPAILDQKP